MNTLVDRDKSLLKLIGRSKDVGDGWRKVSVTLWPMVSMANPDLVELDDENHRVRLTDTGTIVLTYLM